MKKKSLKVLLAGLFIGISAFALAGCQTTGHNAVIPPDGCEVRVVADQATGKKTAVVTLGIANPTIYNITEVELSYDCYKNGVGAPVYTGSDKINVFVSHGVGGYISYTLSEDRYPGLASIDYVTFSENKVTKYQTLFETYMAPFIISFVLVGFSLIFFAFEIFRGGLTAEYLRARMKEKLASYLTILALTLLICLIPLMFSSWVTTIILICGFAASFLLCGLMSLLRMAFIKK